jgi:hypothetical protein
MDSHSLRASLASIYIVPPRERDERPKWQIRSRVVSAVETTRSRARLAADSSQVMVASVEPSHGRFGRFYYGMFVEKWEAVSIRVARVVVETDAYLAGS